MKKRTRDQIIDILATLGDGVEFAMTTKPEAATAILCDCYNTANAVANKLQEGLSGERFAGYGEMLDILKEMLEELNVGRTNGNDCKNIARKIQKHLRLIKNKLLGESEVKLEIAFLPYKAAMWDSMESIWIAARDDKEHCDAYVVPIPYCDKNPDGTPAKWHCEANLFPEYVPVVDYRQYDIAQRRPDVIYIHNPYDDCNYVTAVDSRYYSRELKKYTGMLVYVPYFILGEEWPESQGRLPCYNYMDKMIVPHDSIQIQPLQGRQQDIKYLKDYIPVEKLVPLGSPKADRVFFCEKNKKIPSTWKKMIYGKKVILYNVSISGILSFGDHALQKMQYVFECFAKRKDVVLLWRPHPLLTATIKSMRPDLYKKYKTLENEFVAKRIGILDETSDIDMAVAIADAYLGESTSSVVQLFGIAGKPIFFTTEMMLWKNPSADELASVRFGHMILENEEAWFIAEGYNALCRMKLASGEITPVVKFDDFPVVGGLYNRFLRIDDIILFSPGNTKDICEYNIKTKECKKIPFKNPMEYGNFGHVIRYKNYAFLLPWRYPAILRYNLETGECKYYTKCLQELLACRTPKHDELLRDFCVREQKLLLPSVQTNRILEFDMETGKHQFYTVGKENEGYAFIIESGDEYWLIPRKTSAIVKWNYQTGEWESYDEYPEKCSCGSDWNSGDTYMFSGAVKANGSIWLFPCYANMILRLNLSTEKMEKADIKLPYGVYDRKSNFYMQQVNFFNAFASGENTIVALSAYDRSLVIVDTVSGTCRLQPCRLSESDVKALSTPIEQSFGRVGLGAPYATNENGLWRNVEKFIEYVTSGLHDKNAQQEVYAKFIKNADGSCGKKVHQHIMGQGKP